MQVNLRASGPFFLGRFDDWTVWEIDGNEGRICYTITGLQGSAPLSMDFLPALLVSPRTAEDTAPEGETVDEVSVRSERIARHKGRIRAEIGDRSFPMFKRDGHAWLDGDEAAERALLDAMRRGVAMTVRGLGGKTAFAERFSLLGFTKAQAALSEICGEAARPA